MLDAFRLGLVQHAATDAPKHKHPVLVLALGKELVEACGLNKRSLPRSTDEFKLKLAVNLPQMNRNEVWAHVNSPLMDGLGGQPLGTVWLGGGSSVKLGYEAGLAVGRYIMDGRRRQDLRTNTAIQMPLQEIAMFMVHRTERRMVAMYGLTVRDAIKEKRCLQEFYDLLATSHKKVVGELKSLWLSRLP